MIPSCFKIEILVKLNLFVHLGHKGLKEVNNILVNKMLTANF